MKIPTIGTTPFLSGYLLNSWNWRQERNRQKRLFWKQWKDAFVWLFRTLFPKGWFRGFLFRANRH